MRAFYRFLFAEGLIERDVAGLLDLPRAARQLPDTLDVADVEALLEAPDGARPRWAARDRALLELLYACGLRVSEALGLDLEDIVAGRGERARDRQGRPRAASAGRRRCARGAGPLHRRGVGRRCSGTAARRQWPTPRVAGRSSSASAAAG